MYSHKTFIDSEIEMNLRPRDNVNFENMDEVEIPARFKKDLEKVERHLLAKLVLGAGGTKVREKIEISKPFSVFLREEFEIGTARFSDGRAFLDRARFQIDTVRFHTGFNFYCRVAQIELRLSSLPPLPYVNAQQQEATANSKEVFLTMRWRREDTPTLD